MKEVTLVAAADLTIETELGEITYKKGDTIFLEIDEYDNPFISYHEMKDNKVESFEVDIKSIDVFNSLMENCVILEEEIDENISFEDIPLDVMIIEEGYSISDISRCLAEVSYRKKRVVRGGKLKTIRVGVNRRKKRLSGKARQALRMAGRRSAKNPNSRRARMKSLRVRKRRHLDSVNYFINQGLILKETASDVKRIVSSKILEAFSTKLEIIESKDDILNLKLLNLGEKEVEEVLESTGYNYKIETKEGQTSIEFFKSSLDRVVKSFYEKCEDDDMEEEDCDDMDDEDELDEIKKRESHLTEVTFDLKQFFLTYNVLNYVWEKNTNGKLSKDIYDFLLRDKKFKIAIEERIVEEIEEEIYKIMEKSFSKYNA